MEQQNKQVCQNVSDLYIYYEKENYHKILWIGNRRIKTKTKFQADGKSMKGNGIENVECNEQ
jgi:hypothetical protein